MGGTNNKQEEKDWSQWQNSAQYNQVMQQAYHQTQEAEWGYGSNRPKPNVALPPVQQSNKSYSALKISFDIDVKTIKLEADTKKANLFYVTGEVTNDLPVIIDVCYSAKITFDKDRSQILGITPKNTNDNSRLILKPGEKQPIEPGSIPLNFSNYSLKELTKSYDDVIPVVMTVSRTGSQTPGLEKVIHFFQIDRKSLTFEEIKKGRLLLPSYRCQRPIDYSHRCFWDLQKRLEAFK